MSTARSFNRSATKLLAIRGLKESLHGFGLYVVATIACVLAAVVASTYVGTIEENGLLIIQNPLSPPLYLAIIIGAVYLAVTASVSVSRERDSGTLEVLFYGPVDVASYIMAKFFEQVLTFMVMLLFFVLVFSLFGRLTNFGFSSDMVLSIMLSTGLASGITAFGVFLSSITSRIRVSILVLIALLVLFLGIQWVESFLSGLDPGATPPTLLYAKSFLPIAARAVRWISPLAYMSRGMQAIAARDTLGYVMSFACSLAYSAVLLTLSIFVLREKGVRG